MLGAVSMPLTIISDMLVLAKFLNAGGFCGIAFVNGTVLYVGSCSSVYQSLFRSLSRHHFTRKSRVFNLRKVPGTMSVKNKIKVLG